MGDDIARVVQKRQTATIRALGSFLLLNGVIAGAIVFADRPLAEVLKPPLAEFRPYFAALTYLAKPLTPLASLLLAFVAIRLAAGLALRQLELMLVRVACAVLIAGVITYQLKEAFGRTWPETWVNGNPSYFGSGVFAFFPFHGGAGYASFPSGHMTAIASFAAAFWWLWPSFRWVGVGAVFAVAIGLLGADYHWLSDIIAGTAVGGFTGWVAAMIGRDALARERPRA